MEVGPKVRNNETLEERLNGLIDPGETILAFGMGVIGARTLFAAATENRLILEKVGIGFKRKDLEYFMYDSLEAIEGRQGDSSMPGWAKISIESAIMNRITTSILVKRPGEKVLHIKFRSMPLFKGNGGKGLEIAQVIAERRPDVPTTIDLKAERGDEPGCLVRGLRWGVIAGAVCGVIGAIATGEVWGLAAFFGLGFMLGSIVSAFWRGMKTQMTGRG